MGPPRPRRQCGIAVQLARIARAGSRLRQTMPPAALGIGGPLGHRDRRRHIDCAARCRLRRLLSGRPLGLGLGLGYPWPLDLDRMRALWFFARCTGLCLCLGGRAPALRPRPRVPLRCPGGLRGLLGLALIAGAGLSAFGRDRLAEAVAVAAPATPAAASAAPAPLALSVAVVASGLGVTRPDPALFVPLVYGLVARLARGELCRGDFARLGEGALGVRLTLTLAALVLAAAAAAAA